MRTAARFVRSRDDLVRTGRRPAKCARAPACALRSAAARGCGRRSPRQRTLPAGRDGGAGVMTLFFAACGLVALVLMGLLLYRERCRNVWLRARLDAAAA